MSKSQKIADALGRREMAEALGIGLTAVSNRVVEGKFPASWYLVVSQMCQKTGIDCPPSLFGMKSTDGGSYHDDVLACQSSGENSVPSQVATE